MHFLLEKPSKIIDVTITVRNREFRNEYRDLQNPVTKNLTAQITEELGRFFEGIFGDSFEGIIIIGFFEGSVGVNFELLFTPSSNVTNATVVDELQEANGTQALGFLELGEISAIEQIQPTTQTTVMTSPITQTTVMTSPITQTTVMISPAPSGMCLITDRYRFFFSYTCTSVFSNRHQLTDFCKILTERVIRLTEGL